jgi:hypothetical protein
LPFKPIHYANLRACDALLQLLMLNTRGSLTDSTELPLKPKHDQIARSLLRLKSRQLSNTSLTSIREDLRPGCARWQIWQIKC